MEREERLRRLARKCIGLRYDAPLASKILDKMDWQDYWPVCDGSGLLTGEIVGSENGYYNVRDLAMVPIDELPESERKRIDQTERNDTFDGYAHI